MKINLNKVRKILKEALGGLATLLFLILLMLWLAKVFEEKVAAAPPLEIPREKPANTAHVELRTFPILIDQIGTLKTKVDAKVSSRIMAQVKEISVKEGDEVVGPEGEPSRATVLARLDDRDIQAQLRQSVSHVEAQGRGVESAQAQLESAKSQLEAVKAQRDQATSDYNRNSELYNKDSVSREEVERAKTAKDVSESQVSAASEVVTAAQREVERAKAQTNQAEAASSEAQVTLDYSVVRAPFSGRITQKLVQPGDMVMPGQILFQLESYSQPEIEAVISEAFILNVTSGQKLNVQIDSLGFKGVGTVRDVIPQADPITRTVLVKVALPQQKFPFSGVFARIQIPTGEYKALVVPRNAIRQIGQLHLLDALDKDGHVLRRFVTLGKDHDDLVEALSGVMEGEEVVVP